MNSVAFQDTKLIYRNLFLSIHQHELPERKIMKIIPLTISSNKNKIHRKKYNQGVIDMNSENDHHIGEINWRWHKWKDILNSWIGRINIVQMILIPKAVYTYKACPIKISVVILAKLEQRILKHVGTKRVWVMKTILRKNKTSGITFL